MQAGLPAPFADALVDRLNDEQQSTAELLAADEKHLHSLVQLTEENQTQRVVASTSIDHMARFWILPHAETPWKSSGGQKRSRVRSHRLTLGPRGEPLFYRDIPLLNCIRHSHRMANCCSIALAGEGEEEGLTIFWLTAPVERGVELRWNWLHPKREGTLQYSVACLCLAQEFGIKDMAAYEEEIQMHRDILTSSVERPPESGGKVEEMSSSGDIIGAFKGIVKVFTDVELVSSAFPVEAGGCTFVHCDSRLDADVWHVAEHVKSFPDLPEGVLVNQFPFEGGFLRKDLLGQSVRRYCNLNGAFPSWFLPSFDLSTELQKLLELVETTAEQEEYVWVIKPAMGTRGKGIMITDSLSGVVEASCAPGGDRVAQMYVPNPVLLVAEDGKGRKFDCRTYVFVRSFSRRKGKSEIFVHRWYYARVAAKAFTMSHEALSAKAIHQTVQKYDVAYQTGNNHGLLSRETLLKSEFATYDGGSQNLDLSWQSIEVRVNEMLRELFDGMNRLVSQRQSSRAIYGIDWTPSLENGELVPKLIEVNYCPDLSSINELHGIKPFWEDMFSCLYGEVPRECHERLFPLHQ